MGPAESILIIWSVIVRKLYHFAYPCSCGHLQSVNKTLRMQRGRSTLLLHISTHSAHSLPCLHGTQLGSHQARSRREGPLSRLCPFLIHCRPAKGEAAGLQVHWQLLCPRIAHSPSQALPVLQASIHSPSPGEGMTLQGSSKQVLAEMLYLSSSPTS